MKRTLISIFLICLVTFSHATHLRRSQRETSIDKLKQFGEMNQYASNLYVTINLSLQSGGKVDEVIDFVRQAKTDAVVNKNDLIAAYDAEVNRLTDEINNFATEIATMTGQLDIVVENIDEYTRLVSQNEAKLTRLEGERDSIQQRQQALEDARQNDIDAFNRRQQRDSNAISALEEIIPALENLKENGNAFLEKSHKDIMIALQRIPENKPIQMLVELSTKFNQAKLSEVIIKLGQILESIQQAKVQDEQNEEQSTQRYQSLSFQLAELYHSKSREINAVQTELNQQRQSLRHNITFRDELTTNIEQTTNLKTTTEGILEQTHATHATKLNAANESIEALQTALDILTENEATLEVQEGKSTQ